MPHCGDCANDAVSSTNNATCSKIVEPARRFRDATVVRDSVVLIRTPLRRPIITPIEGGVSRLSGDAKLLELLRIPSRLEQIKRGNADAGNADADTDADTDAERPVTSKAVGGEPIPGPVVANFGSRQFYVDLEYRPCRQIKLIWSIRGVIEDAFDAVRKYDDLIGVGTINLIIKAHHTVIDTNTGRPYQSNVTPSVTISADGQVQCHDTIRRGDTINETTIPITLNLFIAKGFTDDGTPLAFANGFVTDIDGITTVYSLEKTGGFVSLQEGSPVYSITFTSKRDNGRAKLWIAETKPVNNESIGGGEGLGAVEGFRRDTDPTDE